MAKGAVRADDVVPDVTPFLFYVDSFRELNTCRAGGMGLSPIPFSSIVEYAKIYEVEEFEEFLYCIRVMDNKYMEIEEKKNNGPKSNSKKDSNIRRR